jgi:hypothetical protein
VKLITFLSPTHVSLCRDFFLPSYLANHDVFDSLTIRHMPLLCPKGEYRAPGWYELLNFRAKAILEELQSATYGSRILICGCDVQWFGPLGELFRDCKDYDFVAQNDGDGGFCTDWMMIRVMDLTRLMFRQIADSVKDGAEDQYVMNQLLPNSGLTYAQFDNNEVWSTRRLWKIGDPVPAVPPNILVHHGNWTTCVPDKHAILTAVREAQRNA